jgi:hypothetical protein
VLAPKWKAEATQRAEQLAPTLRALQAEGLTLRGIAERLNKRQIATPRGGRWHPQTVGRLGPGAAGKRDVSPVIVGGILVVRALAVSDFAYLPLAECDARVV